MTTFLCASPSFQPNQPVCVAFLLTSPSLGTAVDQHSQHTPTILVRAPAQFSLESSAAILWHARVPTLSWTSSCLHLVFHPVLLLLNWLTR